MHKTPLILILLILSSISYSQTQEEKLFNACESGDYEIIKQYIEEGSDINIDFENGETPLMTACRYNQAEIVKLLVNEEADLNKVNFNGMTAMTILRLQMGINGTFNSEYQTNLRELYAFIKLKGGKEQDFVKLIAENKTGDYNKEQEIVLQIKKDFKNYTASSTNYKTKNFSKIEHEGDEYTFSDNKNRYVSIYNETGKLVFFRYKYDHHTEWHDNGMKEGFDKHYYFKNGLLYFYFETSYYGPFDLTFTKKRYYFNDNKIVVAAIKSYDEWWESMKDESDRFLFKNLVNIKDLETYSDLDEKEKNILEDFNKSYKMVRNLLK